MEPELQKLLMEKRFDQLSLNEKNWVLGNMTVEEYKRFRNFLKLSKTSFEVDFKQLRPNPSIKNRVKHVYQKQFGEKVTPSTFQDNRKVELSVPRPIWIYGTVASFVILAAVVFFESKNRGLGNPNNSTTAMDIDQIENFELLYDQMSLKKTGMYSKIILPETGRKTSLINSDTLLIP